MDKEIDEQRVSGPVANYSALEHYCGESLLASQRIKVLDETIKKEIREARENGNVANYEMIPSTSMITLIFISHAK